MWIAIADSHMTNELQGFSDYSNDRSELSPELPIPSWQSLLLPAPFSFGHNAAGDATYAAHTHIGTLQHLGSRQHSFNNVATKSSFFWHKRDIKPLIPKTMCLLKFFCLHMQQKLSYTMSQP